MSSRVWPRLGLSSRRPDGHFQEAHHDILSGCQSLGHVLDDLLRFGRPGLEPLQSQLTPLIGHWRGKRERDGRGPHEIEPAFPHLLLSFGQGLRQIFSLLNNPDKIKEEAQKEGCEYILQGTIAPDWIETQGGIKTQHNILEQVGIDPATTYGFKIIEPLADLYKDQVRTLGRHLNLPNELSERQPFPGPGLLVRCIGNVTKEKIRVLKEATKMVETSLAPFNYEQYFAAVIENRFAKDPSLDTVPETASEALGLPESEVHADVFEDRVTGVKGDQRCYGLLAGVKLSEESRETYGWLQDRLRQLQAGMVEKFPDITRVAMLVKERRGGGPLSILVRAVSTRDFMTAAVSPVPWKILKDIGQQILKEENVSRVYYDITPKPPGTIEFE